MVDNFQDIINTKDFVEFAKSLSEVPLNCAAGAERKTFDFRTGEPGSLDKHDLTRCFLNNKKKKLKPRYIYLNGTTLYFVYFGQDKTKLQVDFEVDLRKSHAIGLRSIYLGPKHDNKGREIRPE